MPLVVGLFLKFSPQDILRYWYIQQISSWVAELYDCSGELKFKKYSAVISVAA